MKPHNLGLIPLLQIKNLHLIAWFAVVFACIGLLANPGRSSRGGLDLESLSQAQRSARVEIEKQALVAEPLANDSLNNLSVLAQQEGRLADAERFSSLAASRSARDLAAQSQVINSLVVRQDYADALIRIDGLLRAQLEQTPEIFSVVLALARRPDALTQVVKTLASEPPWRRNFFSFASADASQADLVYSILAEMRNEKIALVDGELRGFLKNLVEQKNIEKAYFVWLDFLNVTQLRNVKLIYDGDFSVQSQNLFFDWTAREMAGVNVVQSLRVGGRSDQTLMVDFALAKPTGNLIEQYILLPPGNYVLNGEVDSRNFKSASGLQWQLRCAEKTSGQTLMASSAGSAGWKKTEVAFSVPAQDCAYQKLVLRMEAPLNGLQTLNGQIYFDKLRVMRAL